MFGGGHFVTRVYDYMESQSRYDQSQNELQKVIQLRVHVVVITRIH